mmetsp:Transcript_56783/g.135495  ORF Transcript_56783/g.135495 Transcript_56783/m.135495 type:complete len:206 (-) Transcript_56783:1145-1762(-)
MCGSVGDVHQRSLGHEQLPRLVRLPVVDGDVQQPLRLVLLGRRSTIRSRGCSFCCSSRCGRLRCCLSRWWHVGHGLRCARNSLRHWPVGGRRLDPIRCIGRLSHKGRLVGHLRVRLSIWHSGHSIRSVGLGIGDRLVGRRRIGIRLLQRLRRVRIGRVAVHCIWIRYRNWRRCLIVHRSRLLGRRWNSIRRSRRIQRHLCHRWRH